MIDQSAIDLANSYLDAVDGNAPVALVMLAASYVEATRHVSGGYVRVRPKAAPKAAEPKAITDDWISTGKDQRPD
jgi:hypothetical protein